MKLYLNDNDSSSRKEQNSTPAAYTRERDELCEPYNKEEEALNEIIVTLRLTKKHYKTAHILAHFEGYDSLDEYVSYVVVQSLECDIGNGAIDIDGKKLL